MALQRFARNTLFATIAGASTAIGSLIGSIIVARLLGPSGAGAVALALWIAATAVTLGDLGLPLTVARFLPDLGARGREADGEALGRVFFFPVLVTTLVGVAAAAVLFLFADGLRDRFGIGIPFEFLPRATWLAIGAVFAAQALGNYGMSLLRGEQRFRLAAALSVAAFCLQVASVAFGSYWFGVDGALVGFAAAGVLPAFVVLQRLARRGVLPAELRQRAWHFARHSWGVGLISTIVWSRTELAFLSHWRGAEEAGFYAVAITLSLVATQLPSLATGSLLALFSERHGLGDRAGLQRAFAKSARFMGLLLFPACFGMAAVAPVLLPLFFGPHFTAASDATSLLVAAQAIGALSAISSNFLLAAERSRFLVQIGAVGAAALLVAGLTIIPAFGLMGTAASRAAIQCSLSAAAFAYIGWKLDCPLPLRSLGKIVIGAAACGAVARLIVMEMPTAAGLALAIVAGALVYALSLRLFAALPEEDLSQIAALIERLPAKLARPLLPLVAFFDRERKLMHRKPVR